MKLEGERLLQRHKRHLGLYTRVAQRLNVTPGYVSLVALGQRRNERVMTALLKELRRIDSLKEG